MPKGHSLSIYTHFLGKKRTSQYTSCENAIIITFKDGKTIFFLFASKVRVYILSEYI